MARERAPQWLVPVPRGSAKDPADAREGSVWQHHLWVCRAWRELEGMRPPVGWLQNGAHEWGSGEATTGSSIGTLRRRPGYQLRVPQQGVRLVAGTYTISEGRS